ncbi:hypothetical protein J6590_070030 [Homalodisca vitripennis]|nr:hypothetical protein J6590_070030 [Homalodisca vitripennis]
MLLRQVKSRLFKEDDDSDKPRCILLSASECGGCSKITELSKVQCGNSLGCVIVIGAGSEVNFKAMVPRLRVR